MTLFCAMNVFAQNLYFPPLLGNTWNTTPPNSLGWCDDKIDSLYEYLDQKDTKGFVILKDGKIVIEKYFGSFTQDSFWYWASAGKTLTAFLVGTAQQEGKIDINAKTSQYLGTGWTSEPIAKEDLITVWHQLTMTTGLDDSGDDFCMVDTCLKYKSDAGSRWAYHNAPYQLLENVITNATGSSINTYTTTKVKSKIGMSGLWVNFVYLSRVRDMARFGLLILNKGIWDQDTLLHDQQYFSNMVNPSQNLNQSYGYLWWLNGQQSFMVPELQVVFPGPIFPEAPLDMISALGLNDQKIYVVPSQNLVVVRMGNDAGLPITNFDNELWKKINAVMCSTGIETSDETGINIYPNPVSEKLYLNIPKPSEIKIYDIFGKEMPIKLNGNQIEVSALPSGTYILQYFTQNDKFGYRRFVKN